MAQTITKHIGEGFARGELYAALAYDANDVFGGMQIKGIKISPAAGSAGFLMGDSTTALSYTAGTPPINLYFTSANTSSTNSEPFYLKSIMTGISGYGGRCRFHSYTNVKLTTNFMALKAYAEFGASGYVTGLASAFCAELKLPAAAGLPGGYFPLELEVITPEGFDSAARVCGFIYANASDDATALTAFNTNGVLMWLNGISDTEGGIFEAETNNDSLSMTHVLKIRIVDTDYYIPLNTSKSF